VAIRVCFIFMVSPPVVISTSASTRWSEATL
jgi:hypothetical protein